MTSEKDGYTYDFITDMTYDVYGNIATKTYGNGTTTRYTYDPARQHLTSMVASNSQGEFINATYKYDNIDNILGIDNTAKPVSTISGTYSHSYTYEGDWFFFHTDHLVSTSYLTDTAGNVSQFVCYTPYGEAIVDEHLTTYENPFKFSGKELDDITGLYDHGARNRNPISTLWYGVDILWEKYPEFGAYVYCAGNPVRFIDPDGRGLNGGVVIINESSETLWLGGASGSDGKKEISYSNSETHDFLKLESGQKLVPYNDGDVMKAKIYNIKTGEEIDDVYAYDVDYLQLQDGQTLTDQEGNRYSTDITDKTSVTPASSFTDKKAHPYHEKKGDLKIRGAALQKIGYAGTIVFENNNQKEGEIKCDADNGGYIFQVNVFSPVIYPEKGTIPHNKKED